MDRKINIEYNPAIFHRRIMANFVDLLLFAMVFIFSFIGARAIVQSTDYYKETDTILVSARIDSGLYKKTGSGMLMDIVSFVNGNQEYNELDKKQQLRYAITDFISYLEEEVSIEKSLEVQKKYDDTRLDQRMVYEGVPMFVYSEDTNRVIENEKCKCPHSYYIRNYYTPFIDEYCQGYLITTIPNYYSITKYQTDMLLYAELLPSFLFSGILIYYVPIFIFKRGRKTLGKLIYNISVVDSKYLSPKIGRSLLRQTIYFFGEIFLSIFTFAIPALMSFSMMAFSKKKQGFADYMLGLRDVDSSSNKVYFSLDEITIEHLKKENGGVDFTHKEEF